MLGYFISIVFHNRAKLSIVERAMLGFGYGVCASIIIGMFLWFSLGFNTTTFLIIAALAMIVVLIILKLYSTPIKVYFKIRPTKPEIILLSVSFLITYIQSSIRASSLLVNDDIYHWLGSAKYILYYQKNYNRPNVLSFFTDPTLTQPNGFAFLLAELMLDKSSFTNFVNNILGSIFTFYIFLCAYFVANNMCKNRIISLITPLVLIGGFSFDHHILYLYSVPHVLAMGLILQSVLTGFSERFKSNIGTLFLLGSLYLIHSPSFLLFLITFLVSYEILTIIEFLQNIKSFNGVRREYKIYVKLTVFSISLILLCLAFSYWSSIQIELNPLFAREGAPNFQIYWEDIGFLNLFFGYIGIFIPLIIKEKTDVKYMKIHVVMTAFFALMFIITRKPQQWYYLTRIGWDYPRYFSYLSLTLSIFVPTALSRIIYILNKIKIFLKYHGKKVNLFSCLLILTVNILATNIAIDRFNTYYQKLKNPYSLGVTTVKALEWLAINSPESSICLDASGLNNFAAGILAPRVVISYNYGSFSEYLLNETHGICYFEKFLNLLKQEKVNYLIIYVNKQPNLYQQLLSSSFFKEIYVYIYFDSKVAIFLFKGDI